MSSPSEQQRTYHIKNGENYYVAPEILEGLQYD